MKRIISAILSAAMLLAFPASAESEITPLKKVITDWMNFVIADEWVCNDLLWALSYMESYVEQPSWENLQKARAAVSTAKQYTDLRQPFEVYATTQDYIDLEDQGLDVAMVEEEMLNLQTHLNEFCVSAQLMETKLYDDSVFWQPELDSLRAQIEVWKMDYEQNLRYLAVSTNYLEAVVGAEASASMSETLAQHAPTVTALRAEYPLDQKTLKDESEKILMVIAAMVNRQKEIVDRNEVLFEIYKEAYETDDWTEYTTQKVQIDGLTHVLPDPYWSVGDNATYSYSWDDANGNNRYLSNREDITEPPTGCFVTYTDISLEDAQMGLSILSSETFIPGTESAYLASFEYEGSEIFLRWKDNELDLMVEGEQICFVPFWYE